MPRRIALFGGSFNPPGTHHRRAAEILARDFDEVRVLPCGPRPDKATTNSVPPVFRATLTDLTFGGMRRVVVDLSDLEQDRFTTNWDLQKRLERDGEVWHVVGADLITGGAQGRSAIQRGWKKGKELWRTARFAVLSRLEHPVQPADLPPRHRVIQLDVPGSSTEIRTRLEHGSSVAGLVTPRAQAYIARYGLHRAPVPGSWFRGSLAEHGYFLYADRRNAKAAAWAARLRARGLPAAAADFILAVGGDGTMLRCIREHWRRRLPFFGINAGNLGFLMNRRTEPNAADFPPGDVIYRQLPMLFLEFTDAQGRTTSTHGFNDAWVERSTSQSAWLEVTVNGVRRLPKLVSDGALVATAAGSTAYARSMGAAPLLADTPAWLLVGSNVMEPANWRSALLSTDTTVEIRCLEPRKRPIEAFVDGQSHGDVVAMKARISRAAAVELVFRATHDMAEKIAAIQFSGSGG